jgi:hypothetical protein
MRHWRRPAGRNQLDIEIPIQVLADSRNDVTLGEPAALKKFHRSPGITTEMAVPCLLIRALKSEPALLSADERNPSRLLLADRQHFLSNTAKMTEGVDDDFSWRIP